MVKKKLQKMLLAFSILGASFMSVRPFTWAPIGDVVDAEGYATEGGAYFFGDAITQNFNPYPGLTAGGAPPTVFNSSFFSGDASVIPGGDTTLNIVGELLDPAAPDGFDDYGVPLIDNGLPLDNPGFLALNRVLDGGGFPIPVTLKVDGDVTVDAASEDLTINLKSDVVLEPYQNSLGTTPIDPGIADGTTMDAGQLVGQTDGGGVYGLGFSQIFFNCPTGRKITFNVDWNVEFTGRTVDPAAADFTDMIVTFNGAGRTCFRMADGTQILFDGDLDTGSSLFIDQIDGCEQFPIDGTPAFTGFFNSAGGTRVYITMDQTLDQVTKGQNKLVFERKTVAEQDPTTVPNIPFPADPSLRNMIYVGYNSLITYLSDNFTGEVDTLGDFAPGGFGSMEFDVSNPDGDAGTGSGRMILMIRGAYFFGIDNTLDDYLALTEKFPFNDGSVVIAGHFVESDAGEFFPDLVGTTVDLSAPAGRQAIMAITDNSAYAQHMASNPGVPYAPTFDDRRGLLIFNDCANHGKLMSDPYWDLYNVEFDGAGAITFQTEGNFWAASNPDNFNIPTRKGFVVGVNGKLDIYHNTYCDHVAAFVNNMDAPAMFDFFVDEIFIKRRNPSALIIDGLDPRLYPDPAAPAFTGNPFTLASTDFVVADPFTRPPEDVRQAEIQLRGNGALYMRSSGSTTDGYAFNYWGDYFDLNNDPADPLTLLPALEPFTDPFADYLASLAVGDFGVNPSFPDVPEAVTYDGFQLLPSFQTVQIGEGEHVLDVEGPVRIISRPNVLETPIDSLDAAGNVIDTYCGTVEDPYAVDPVQRNYDEDSVKSSSGVVRAVSVWMDHTGQEILPDGSRFLRPLLADGTTYARYNSPGIFMNNFMSFFDSHFVHSDATKLVNATPQSDPAIVGGERYHFSFTTIPELVDSEIAWLLDPNGLSFAIDLDPDRYRTPELRLFNSHVHMQESLCATGVRMVVMDVPSLNTVTGGRYSGLGGSNNSSLKFYDHGDRLDTGLTGYGRVLVLGSMLANMTNILYDVDFQVCEDILDQSNFGLETAYCNVFRHNSPQVIGGVPVDQGYDCSNQPMINLSLQNGDTSFGTCEPVLQRHFHPGVPESSQHLQRGHHLFIIGITDNGINNVHVGWPRAMGDSIFFPYPDELTSPADADLFELDALLVRPACLTIDGKVMCLGAFDFDGFGAAVPATGSGDDNGVFYIDHGGKISVTPKNVTLAGARFDGSGVGRPEIKPSELCVDTIIAQRIWGDYDKQTNTRTQQYSGVIDLPHDQTVFGENYAVQPYGFTAEMFAANVDGAGARRGFVRLPARNELSEPNAASSCGQRERQPYADRTGIEEMLVGWFYREYRGDVDGALGGVPELPVKSKLLKALRSTETIAGPVTAPTDLLYVGPGDTIQQMRVAGATMSDPFHLLVSGHTTLPIIGRVREFATEKTTRDLATERLVGEGAHAALFLEYGGCIGLGDRDWNAHSVNAWNILGKDFVSIYPMGNGKVEVNSNLIVSDPLAIVATDSFSDIADDASAHKLTFYSAKDREIRVPAYGELDLRSFAQNLPAGKQHMIAFEGKVCLIFEEGARLRLPDNDGLVLYFSDDAKLIFEGRPDPVVGRQFDDEAAALASETPSAPIDDVRSKIVGKAQIWLNRNAAMEVNDGALVGVQSDDLSPETNLVVSIQRQGSLHIGNGQVGGGALEIGNPYDRNALVGDPFGESVENQGNHSINFTILTNGRLADVTIAREGFLGFGAGVIRKFGNPNGRATELASTAPSGLIIGPNPVLDATGAAIPNEDGYPQFNPDIERAWQVRQLYNVNNVNVELTRGMFIHNNMVDGSSNESSLMAIGPANSYRWALNGQGEVSVRGGGNLMHVPFTENNTVYTVNVWDYAGGLSDLDERYGILASGKLLEHRQEDVPSVVFGNSAGRAFTVADGPSFFSLLNIEPFNEQGTTFQKKVNFAIDDHEHVFDYTTSDPGSTPKYAPILAAGVASGTAEIVRDENPNIIGADSRNVEAASNSGSLGAYGTGTPTRFVISR